MSHIIHCHLDIIGALENRRWHKSFTVDGRPATPEEAKRYLREELKSGRLVMPIGEPCEGFSFQTGCPGHPAPSSPGAETP